MPVKQSPLTTVAAALAFVALTVIVTYPQVLSLGTSVPFHSDPYFSMWRLGWVAHALVHSPRELFDANIFYPERHTLAYSDAMLLPGTVLAPLFWAGINPVAIYNLSLFAAFTLSGLATFVLARDLTGNTTAAFVAGVIYAFSPYRFGHYMHFELQMVFWIPLALLLIHKIVASGRVRDGAFLGVVVGCQLLSSVYNGIFLSTYCAFFVPCLLAAMGTRRWRTLVLPLVLGGIIAAAFAAPYASAYSSATDTVGTRTLDDVRRYSASLTHFMSAPQMNRLYGWTAITDPIWADEMNLFPGITAIGLALLGIFGGRSRVRFAYIAALIFAIAMTAGTNGFVYVWIFEHVPLFRGLRSTARFDILVVISQAVLGAYGVAYLLERMQTDKGKRIVGGVIVSLLVVEFASAPSLSPAPEPSRVDAYLAHKPPSVIVELPMRSNRATWGSVDFLYMYQGIPHFQKMVNGYSGYAPASYYRMRDDLDSFPDDRSVESLRDRGVDYLVIRGGLMEPWEATVILDQLLLRHDLSLEVMWMAGPEGEPEAIFKVLK
ncbi:MAG: glycosyltransferase family 39 protein [Vicinamibacterales bacterium]|nr:glycosyltransferase family 39 protein [Vicinamibacterales bacterium]